MNPIYARRSIRRFLPDPVARETLIDLVKAGMSAPSAGNEQPWQFLVLTERSILGKIMEIHPHAAMLKEAPAAILVCGDLSLEVHPGFWVQDCAAATENILLEIVQQGLGGVWLGVHPVEDRVRAIRALFGLPASIMPFSLVAVGKPAEEKQPVDRFQESRVRFNRWQ